MTVSQAMIRFEERITAACRSGEITQEYLDTLPPSPMRRFGKNCLKAFRELEAKRLADDTPDAGIGDDAVQDRLGDTALKPDPVG